MKAPVVQVCSRFFPQWVVLLRERERRWSRAGWYVASAGIICWEVGYDTIGTRCIICSSTNKYLLTPHNRILRKAFPIAL